jgi:hypothetical protein
MSRKWTFALLVILLLIVVVLPCHGIFHQETVQQLDWSNLCPAILVIITYT